MMQIRNLSQSVRLLAEHNGLKMPDASQPLPEAHDAKETKAAPSAIVPEIHTKMWPSQPMDCAAHRRK